jgi:hypothetical protein
MVLLGMVNLLLLVVGFLFDLARNKSSADNSLDSHKSDLRPAPE